MPKGKTGVAKNTNIQFKEKINQKPVCNRKEEKSNKIYSYNVCLIN